MPNSPMKHLTGVFRATDTHKITRNRKPVSCTICQKRKSKCDRAKPSCGACHKRGDPSSCVYGDTSALGGKQEMQLKVARLEEMVMRLAAASEASSAVASVDTGTSASEFSPRGMEEGSDAIYPGETSWEAVVKGIRDIQNVLHTQDESDHRGESELPPPAPDIVIGGISPITIAEVRSSLPSRQDADVLVAAYFNSKFIAIPFIHSRHFSRRYELLWSASQSPNFLWLSIMFSVLGLGAMISKAQTHHPQSVQGPEFYIQRSAQCLVTGEYLKARPYSVEALMMYAHSRNVTKKDSDATIWSLYSLAVRLAQRRGYHLDSHRVSPTITQFEAEMRRRTWFMVQTSDLLFSFQLGMPPMVYQEVCDAGHPRNLSDDDFDEDTEVPESRPPTEPSPMLAWQTKSHLCRLLRRALRHVLRVESPPYEETIALQAELESYHNTVPECFRIRPIASTPWDVPGHTIMHRLIIEISYLKTICILHRPYLRAENNQERYRASRELCRATAVRVAELHLEFEHETRPGGRMYDNRFLLSSLTLHDFLVASMILCLDLLGSTDITPQVHLQHTQILKRIHKIWEERGLYSKDARYGARVIRATLDRVAMPPSTRSSWGAQGLVNIAHLYTEPASCREIADFIMPDMNYSGDYEEFLPLNTIFGPTEGFDWVSSIAVDSSFNYLPTDTHNESS
ncbi:hypothetical protein FLONG3_9241 [Fusarium longipes]|uniref:Zn(2)-C6 fungal-type domain-containing protein n=1 Tax=Fusarium longipes TaxID=694270 RepID=A0A395RZ79_9HYPO|nr:hypothetical protein FLONG3_9241 [Fusarium longipes]